MFKKLLVCFAAFLLITGGAVMAADWDKTFPKSDNVDVKKVSFKNR